jgi:hypothetical protein
MTATISLIDPNCSMVMEGVLHLCALGAALALIRRPTLTRRSVHVR